MVNPTMARPHWHLVDGRLVQCWRQPCPRPRRPVETVDTGGLT